MNKERLENILREYHSVMVGLLVEELVNDVDEMVLNIDNICDSVELTPEQKVLQIKTITTAILIG